MGFGWFGYGLVGLVVFILGDIFDELNVIFERLWLPSNPWKGRRLGIKKRILRGAFASE